MKRFGILILITVALVGITLSSIVRVHGDVHTAQYKGSMLCKACHQNTHKAVVDAYVKSAHVKALQKADAQGAIVADFSASPPFTKDKVAWVLGKGKQEQAYLDANLQVLPGIWNVQSKSWKPAEACDGATQCVACHVTGYDPAKNTWVEPGVGCEMCHGPGSEHMGNPTVKESIARLKGFDSEKQAMVCGQCHSKGKDISGKYAHPVGFRPGDDLTKFFVDAKPTTPGRNQQYSELITSKHYQMLKMHCTTCHDSHGPVGTNPSNLKQPIVQQCLGCHAAKIKDMATHAPNAAPDATCASCHMEFGQHTFKKPEKQQ